MLPSASPEQLRTVVQEVAVSHRFGLSIDVSCGLNAWTMLSVVVMMMSREHLNSSFVRKVAVYLRYHSRLLRLPQLSDKLPTRSRFAAKLAVGCLTSLLYAV